MIKKYIFFLFFCFFSNSYSQISSSRIDSLLDLSEKHLDLQNFDKSISEAKKALLWSEKIKLDKGIAESYYLIANSLCTSEKYKESIKCISDFENRYDYILRNSDEISSRFARLSGRNYLVLGFRKEALKNFKKSWVAANKIIDKKKKNEMTYRALISLTAYYQGSDKKDSVYYYLNKTKTIINKISQAEVPIFYYNLSYYHLNDSKHIDSADFYNNKGLLVDSLFKRKYLTIGLLQKAEILNKQRQFSQSNKFSFKGLYYAKKQNRADYISEFYTLISHNFKELNMHKQQVLYMDSLLYLKDSISLAKLNAAHASSDQIVDRTLKTQLSKKKYLIYTIVIIALILMVFVFSFFYYFKKMKKKATNLSLSQQKEVSVLEEKLKENFLDEIYESARLDSSDFMIKFNEVFPDFVDNLLKIDPDLKISEITFCALLKLNFSTKQIATYTFVTPKAVQNRKNRIRKKLNIPSDEDIYIWFSKQY